MLYPEFFYVFIPSFSTYYPEFFYVIPSFSTFHFQPISSPIPTFSTCLSRVFLRIYPEFFYVHIPRKPTPTLDQGNQ